MKKYLLMLTVMLAFMLFMSQCKKDDHTIFKSYFYTSVNPDIGSLSLYIDDQYKGELPYLQLPPACGSDSIMDKTIFMNLESGDYRVKAYDKNGKLKSDNKIRFSSTSSGGSGFLGGSEMSVSGECLIVNIYY